MTVARSNSIFAIKGPFKVLVSLVTLWSFLFSTVAYDISISRPLGFIGQAWAARTPLELSGDGSNRAGGPGFIKELNVENFGLPEYLGSIKDSWSPQNRQTGEQANRQTIIHIQDAHCNYAAQHKISEIIEYLNKEYGINTVNLEGGAGDYDLSIFTDIVDRDIRAKASDYFVKEGLVNGSEYFAINNPDKVRLWGIEDISLYIDNLKAYRNSLRYKDEVDKGLKTLSYILTNLKIHIYSKDLLELDAKYIQYKADNFAFKEYLNYLIQKARGEGVDIKMLANICLLNRALEQEGAIDFKKANNQRDDLIDKLQKKLSKRSLEELVLKTVKFRSEKISQKDFYTYLIDKIKLVDIDLKDYPELDKYIAYISVYDDIDKVRVMDEMETLEKMLKEVLYQNDKQKELDRLSKSLALTKNIFNISITPDDYKFYKKNEAAFGIGNYVKFISREASLYKIAAELDDNIGILDQYREEMAKFYEYSLKRDAAFLNNIRFDGSLPVYRFASLPVQNRPTGKQANRPTILVTGGFHTENLAGLFKRHGISYITIMPNFKNQDGYECSYFRILSGQKSLEIKEALPSVLKQNLAIPDPLNPAVMNAVRNATTPLAVASATVTSDGEKIGPSQISTGAILKIFKELQKEGIKAKGKTNEQPYLIRVKGLEAMLPEKDLYGYKLSSPVRIIVGYFTEADAQVGVSYFIYDPAYPEIIFSKGTKIGSIIGRGTELNEHRDQGLRSSLLDELRKRFQENTVLISSIENDTTVLQINKILLGKQTLSIELKHRIRRLYDKYNRYLEQRKDIGMGEVIEEEDRVELAHNIYDAYQENAANRLSGEELSGTLVGGLGKRFGDDQYIEPRQKDGLITIVHIIRKGGLLGTVPAAAPAAAPKPAVGNALKYMGTDSEDVDPDILDGWKAEADKVNVSTKKMRLPSTGEVIYIDAKFIVVNDMPEGMMAYHFRDKRGQLVIVTAEPYYEEYQDNRIAESIYHEAMEDLWEHHKDITKEDSHRLASVDQVLAFGFDKDGNVMLTLCHAKMLQTYASKSHDMLKKIVNETEEKRSAHHRLIIKHFLVDFAVVLERIKEYEAMIRAKASEKLLKSQGPEARSDLTGGNGKFIQSAIYSADIEYARAKLKGEAEEKACRLFAEEFVAGLVKIPTMEEDPGYAEHSPNLRIVVGRLNVANFKKYSHLVGLLEEANGDVGRALAKRIRDEAARLNIPTLAAAHKKSDTFIYNPPIGDAIGRGYLVYYDKAKTKGKTTHGKSRLFAEEFITGLAKMPDLEEGSSYSEDIAGLSRAVSILERAGLKEYKNLIMLLEQAKTGVTRELAAQIREEAMQLTEEVYVLKSGRPGSVRTISMRYWDRYRIFLICVGEAQKFVMEDTKSYGNTEDWRKRMLENFRKKLIELLNIKKIGSMEFNFSEEDIPALFIMDTSAHEILDPEKIRRTMEDSEEEEWDKLAKDVLKKHDRELSTMENIKLRQLLEQISTGDLNVIDWPSDEVELLAKNYKTSKKLSNEQYQIFRYALGLDWGQGKGVVRPSGPEGERAAKPRPIPMPEESPQNIYAERISKMDLAIAKSASSEITKVFPESQDVDENASELMHEIIKKNCQRNENFATLSPERAREVIFRAKTDLKNAQIPPAPGNILLDKPTLGFFQKFFDDRNISIDDKKMHILIRTAGFLNQILKPRIAAPLSVPGEDAGTSMPGKKIELKGLSKLLETSSGSVVEAREVLAEQMTRNELAAQLETIDKEAFGSDPKRAFNWIAASYEGDVTTYLFVDSDGSITGYLRGTFIEDRGRKVGFINRMGAIKRDWLEHKRRGTSLVDAYLMQLKTGGTQYAHVYAGYGSKGFYDWYLNEYSKPKLLYSEKNGYYAIDLRGFNIPLAEGNVSGTAKKGIETRQAADIEAFEVSEGRDSEVKIIVVLPKGMRTEEAMPVLRPINRGLSDNGFGRIDDKQQIIILQDDIKEIKKRIDEEQKGLSDNGRIVVFAPQTETGNINMAGELQRGYPTDKGSVIIVPDAYSDANPIEKEYPDVMARVVLGRNIAYYRILEARGQSTKDALWVINNLLSKVVDGFVPIVTIDDLLNILKPLRIKPVDYKEITDWQKSQEAVATAL